MRGIASKYFGADVRKLTIYDEEGIVFGYPSVVDIDVIVKNKIHILVEIKSRAEPGDVIKLLRVTQLYEKKTGIKTRLAIVAGYVPPKAREAALKTQHRHIQLPQRKIANNTLHTRNKSNKNL